MIKFKKENSTKVTGKGILKKVSEKGLEIEDTKTGELGTITFDMLKEFINLDVAFSLASKTDDE